jgi:hypothetical protein
MPSHHTIRVILLICTLCLLPCMATVSLAEQPLTLEFYYASTCESCEVKLNIIENEFVDNETYESFLTVVIKDIATNDTYRDEWRTLYDSYPYPFVIFKNDTMTIGPIGEFEITVANLQNQIDFFEEEKPQNETPSQDDNIISTPFGPINISGLSLPILTIILGGLDSFNPCAFFILIFLLNLLLYARSRRRMLLIGGVFIFFSGLLYAMFMFVLFEVFFLSKVYVTAITLIAGSLACILGVLNIKDFFFFKKGASLSIPDEKKPGLYKQMRNLVKNPRVTAAIIGTIVLAGTVNFYELLCTLGLPLIFTQKLSTYALSSAEYSSYIFFYNIVYVIPLIIIVLIFVVTLGKRKLTERHGQIMKLVTGIMLTSFGVLFLLNYKILEHIITPIVLLVFSLVAAAVISQIWKHYKNIA